MIKRNKIKIKDRDGSFRNKEDKIRDSFSDSEQRVKEAVKILPEEQKKEIDIVKQLEKTKEDQKTMQSSKSIDETNVYKKKTTDKDMSIQAFTTLIRKHLHPNFYVVFNPNLGQQAGHYIFFHSLEGPEYVTAVGKACDKTVHPETKVEKVYNADKNDWERQIQSRGWIAALDILMNWMKKHKIPIRNIKKIQ